MNSRPVTPWLPILGLLAGLTCAPSLAVAQPVALRYVRNGVAVLAQDRDFDALAAHTPVQLAAG